MTTEENFLKRVTYYSELIGVEFNKIKLKKMKSRWGSCSIKKNINFNSLLLQMPQEVIDSIIVHELCHLLQMNHSKKFYNEVLKYCPNYYACKKWLNKNGREIIKNEFK